MKIFLLILTIGLCANAWSDRIDQNVAFDLFLSGGVHQFLKKNCAHCHDEVTSGFMEAPQHSNSDPAVAFPVFMKKLNNWSNPAQSTLLNYANTKHFCTKLKYNCDKADGILNELNELIFNYVNDVKVKSSAANSFGKNNKLNLDNGKVLSVVTLDDKVVDGPNTKNVNLKFNVPFQIKSISMGWAMSLELEFTKISDGYFRLDKTILATSSGFFKTKGMYLVINGLPYPNQTGLERLDRGLIFKTKDPNGEALRIVLSDAQPILNLNNGDTVQVAFEQFEMVDKFPSRLCDKIEKAHPKGWDRANLARYFREIAGALGTDFANQANSFWMNPYEHLWQNVLENHMDFCYEVESRIDFGMTNRSLLVTKALLVKGQYQPEDLRRVVLETIENLRAMAKAQ